MPSCKGLGDAIFSSSGFSDNGTWQVFLTLGAPRGKVALSGVAPSKRYAPSVRFLTDDCLYNAILRSLRSHVILRE